MSNISSLSRMFFAVSLLGGTAVGAAPAHMDQVDERQAQTLIEYGPHILTGRPGVSRKPLPGDGQAATNRKSKSPTERVYSIDEVVYLLPYTDEVAKAVARGKSSLPLTRAEVLTGGGAALRYNARTVTAKDGSFRFRGLKAGRYLLITEIPYKAAVIVRNDTGRTVTETSVQGFPVFQGGAQIGFVPQSSTSVTSPVYRYDKAISDLRHYIVKVVEVRGDVPVTALGEIE